MRSSLKLSISILDYLQTSGLLELIACSIYCYKRNKTVSEIDTSCSGLMRAILGDFNFNLVLHEFEVDCFLDKETENFVRSKKDFKFVSVKSVSCPLSSQPEYKEYDFIHNVYWPRMGPGALIPIISWGD